MLRAILAPSPNVRLDDVSTVHKRHLAVGLDPHLVPRVRRNRLQRRDVDPELPGLGELADADSEREEVCAGDRSRQIGYRQAKIVDSTPMQTEDIAVVGRGIVGRCDQGIQGTSCVVCQLGEQRLGLFLSELAHFE